MDGVPISLVPYPDSPMPHSLEAVTTTYNEVEKLVANAAYRVYRKYGGDIQELLSEAGEQFMYAYERYVPERGEFSKWVTFVVFRMLVETVRKKTKEKARLGARVEYDVIIQEPPFDYDAFLANVSEDGREAIFVASVVHESFEGGRVPQRQTLVRMVRDRLSDMGWDKARITTVFEEIREAL